MHEAPRQDLNLDPEIKTQAQIKSQMSNQLNHPGILKPLFF